jgi:hypothetical protein
MKILLIILFIINSYIAYAVDGVVEINQTCATQSGCFSGDIASFPVTIDGSVGKSYRLTSDLVLPDENSNGILIESPNVSIDFNRFGIIRQACIDLPSIECIATSGVGRGVTINSIVNTGISIFNGSITGMGESGISLGGVSQVNNVNVKWCRTSGVSVGTYSVVKNNIIHDNGTQGILTRSGTKIIDNLVYENGSNGISHSENGGYVYGNVVRKNGASGLRLVDNTAYRGNVITNNTGGTVVGGFNLLNNFCDTNDVCP